MTIRDDTGTHSHRGALLSLAGVSRVRGERQVLAPFDLDVAPGECVALLGRNGSGKSTLLRIAAGRDRPTTGSVTFDGGPMDENDPRVRARVAVAGDALACYPDLTVRQHLELVATGHGVPDAELRVTEALAAHGLTSRADALPTELSSGQLQETLLAAALLRPADLLLLDEPEARLDPAARERLAAALTDRVASGTALLLVTHHRPLAAALADRTFVLTDGVPAAS
ncbi:ATP-binding cassette domain-containing protein [Streptomyces sp. RFCAC02]|uniref:ABC transporter ATP-binding protein n=1 Tax=Streptomyces sp. RFCAC02 TaxID=2499143 RepID=UPI00101E9AE0|nr:ATP-binding cassette domain-containing protein [Streptomyces sp. RFCAC02]